MRSSYKEGDVILLLKDVTGQVIPKSTEERERLIQSGRHYCEMLPIEYKPTDEYLMIYEQLLKLNAKKLADAVGRLADEVVKKKGTKPVLVSLARAGIPAGILLKRFFKYKYGIDVAHYGISIIRGVGIDKNAMEWILDRHSGSDVVFIDGWTGKGAIKGQLDEALKEFDSVRGDLGVLADPAGVAEFAGSREDLLIPSCCLNSTVSGLISRTYYNKNEIGPMDFHGAVYYEELESTDRSYDFIESIEEYFEPTSATDTGTVCRDRARMEVSRIAKKFGIKDVNLVKPSLGEATRVLLRRVPDAIVVSSKCWGSSALRPIIQLAKEKKVPIEIEPLECYKAIGVIKALTDV